MNDGELARLEDVAVDRDVDAVDPVEHRLRVVVDPDGGDVLDLGRIEVARADERDVAARRPRRRR